MNKEIRRFRRWKEYPSRLYIAGGIFFVLIIAVLTGVSLERIDHLYLQVEKGLADIVLTSIPGFSGTVPVVFKYETLFKKWKLFLLFLFWITRSPVKKKVTASLILIATDYFFVVVYLILGPWLLDQNINYDHFKTLYFF